MRRIRPFVLRLVDKIYRILNLSDDLGMLLVNAGYSNFLRRTSQPLNILKRMKRLLPILGWLLAIGLPAQNVAPVVQIAVTDISCAGQSDGQLELTLLSGTTPVPFQWTNLNTAAQGAGQFAALNQPIVLPNLKAGLYRFKFASADGVDTVIQRLLNEPFPLHAKLFLLTDFSGFQVPCADGADGKALLDATGGTLPLTYLWSNGDKGSRADSLPAGPVSVTVSDANGCTLTADTTLTAPPPITAVLEVVGETCFGQNTGRIGIQAVSGGVPPYQYALNNDPPGSQLLWTDQPHGPYFLHISDAAGCVHTEGVILPSGLEFTLKLGNDTAMLSGDSLLLQLQISPPADTLIWQPSAGVHMLTPDLVLLTPFLSTTYQVIARSADGCLAQDDLRVSVNRDRSTYAPNAFAPDAQNSENRSFTLFGGAGIRTIAWLQVYDRFGRLWFENRNFPINDPASGWNGSGDGDDAPPGVYLWRALLRYTDGREVRLQGDLTLIR